LVGASQPPTAADRRSRRNRSFRSVRSLLFGAFLLAGWLAGCRWRLFLLLGSRFASAGLAGWSPLWLVLAAVRYVNTALRLRLLYIQYYIAMMIVWY